MWRKKPPPRFINHVECFLAAKQTSLITALPSVSSRYLDPLCFNWGPFDDAVTAADQRWFPPRPVGPQLDERVASGFRCVARTLFVLVWRSVGVRERGTRGGRVRRVLESHRRRREGRRLGSTLTGWARDDLPRVLRGSRPVAVVTELIRWHLGFVPIQLTNVLSKLVPSSRPSGQTLNPKVLQTPRPASIRSFH